MRNRWVLKVYFFFQLILVLGCKSFVCNEVQLAVVDYVNGPEIGKVNQEIILTVWFSAANGCGNFHSISDSRNGKNINVEVKVKYTGCICPDIIVSFEKEYVFSTKEAGEYNIVFLNNVIDNITHTITIN